MALPAKLWPDTAILSFEQREASKEPTATTVSLQHPFIDLVQSQLQWAGNRAQGWREVTCDEMIDLSHVCWQSSSPEENLKVTDNFSSGPMTKHFHSFSELLEWFSKSIETEESNARTPVRRLMTWLDTNKYCQVSHSDHRNFWRKLTVIFFNKPWSWGGVLPKQLEKYHGKHCFHTFAFVSNYKFCISKRWIMEWIKISWMIWF